jgi:hypothetical protein
MFREHPEPYPEQAFRGWCHGINMLTMDLEVELDLGFNLSYTVVGGLYNLSLPDLQSQVVAEGHQAQACLDRLVELVHSKPVLVLVLRRPVLHPAAAVHMFQLFYHMPTRDVNWHSLEKRLVDEGHAAWQDPMAPTPSVASA